MPRRSTRTSKPSAKAAAAASLKDAVDFAAAQKGLKPVDLSSAEEDSDVIEPFLDST